MSGTAQPGAVPRGAPWGAVGHAPPGWAPPPGTWNPWAIPKPWLIAAMVLGFIIFWPVGLAILFFMLGSGRIGGRWARRHGMQPGAGGGPCGGRGWLREEAAPSSGNRAFDEYRQETLRRLEEEQRDFSDFLERLRFAKDKAEFDQFMAERRQQPPAPQAQDPEPQG